MDGTLNGVYAERNALVAALSKIFPSSLERHVGEEWEDDWRWVVFVNLPTGQCTWHIHDTHLSMFHHLQRETGVVWDGHSTTEKYDRIYRLQQTQSQKP